MDGATSSSAPGTAGQTAVKRFEHIVRGTVQWLKGDHDVASADTVTLQGYCDQLCQLANEEMQDEAALRAVVGCLLDTAAQDSCHARLYAVVLSALQQEFTKCVPASHFD